MFHTLLSDFIVPKTEEIWTRNKYFIIERENGHLSLKGKYFSQDDIPFFPPINYIGRIDDSNKLFLSLTNPENYRYFFIGNNENKLPEYTYMTFDEINNLIEYNFIPYNCKKIGIYDLYDNLNGFISIDKKENKDAVIYKVGLISDIHYNDWDSWDNNPDTYPEDSSYYYKDFINACKFFKKENIDFIAASGDVTTDSRTHHNNFRLCCNKYLDNNISFYTCSGNHDTKPKKYFLEGNGAWNRIQAINPKHPLAHSENDEGTSFFIIKETRLTKDIFIFLDVEYGWDINNYDTHNCRLLTKDELLIHKQVDESNDYHLYNPKTLLWLERILEKYKDNRCFIFTHIMWENHAGTYHDGWTYYNYYAGHADVLRGDQGEFLFNLLNKYDNNIWFNGHSHYKFNWQTVDNRINITKADSNSYVVHIPSLARPLRISQGYDVALEDSECYIMEIHKNKVLLKGIEMRTNKLGDDYSDTEKYLNKYTPIAQYSLPVK